MLTRSRLALLPVIFHTFIVSISEGKSIRIQRVNLYVCICSILVNEMTQEHGIMRMEDIKEEKVVEQKREEAKKRLENFRNITTTGMYRLNLLSASENSR